MGMNHLKIKITASAMWWRVVTACCHIAESRNISLIDCQITQIYKMGIAF
jgi:hypothetical protein